MTLPSDSNTAFCDPFVNGVLSVSHKGFFEDVTTSLFLLKQRFVADGLLLSENQNKTNNRFY